MRVVSDRDRCMGFASCVISAPEVFDLGADSLVVVLDGTPAEAQRPEIDEAVRSCPRRAIWVED